MHLAPTEAVDGDPPAIVFVHGLLGYSFSWRHNLEFFSRQHHAYAVDLLGIGHSERPLDGAVSYGIPAAAGRLLDFLRSLGHPRIDLVATSHGGAVAMLAAAMDRKCSAPIIRRMVLVAPANPFMMSARLHVAFFRTPFGRLLLKCVLPQSHLLRRRTMGRLFGDPTRLTEETRRGYEVNLMRPESFGYVSEVLRTWYEDMEQVLKELPLISNVPVLLLWGSRDAAVDLQSGLLLRECFRNPHFLVLEGAGHLPYEEMPAEFNRAVTGFLEY